MSKFVIPKGKAFEFNVFVKDTESFIVKDLTNMDTAVLKLVNPEDYAEVLTVDGVVVDSTAAVNGVIKFSLSTDDTALLDRSARGDKVDWYYKKPRYKAEILIKFTDEQADMLVMIDKVYVV